MYTFQALADNTGSHVGFYIVVVLAVVFLATVWTNLVEDSIGGAITVSLIVGLAVLVAYGASFHDVAPKNEQVTATFVGFQPEGYREQSGKQKVDRHYMYVVYNVNGQNVILQGQAGVSYPQTAILYKN